MGDNVQQYRHDCPIDVPSCFCCPGSDHQPRLPSTNTGEQQQPVQCLRWLKRHTVRKIKHHYPAVEAALEVRAAAALSCAGARRVQDYAALSTKPMQLSAARRQQTSPAHQHAVSDARWQPASSRKFLLLLFISTRPVIPLAHAPLNRPPTPA